MHVVDLGTTNFLDAYDYQIDTLKRVSQGLLEDTLLITEHRPVITIGRKGSRNNILRSQEFLNSCGIQVLDTDRGGDVTYHGPGQIVAYPIFRLENEARDIHHFLNLLEEVGLDFLSQYGILGDTRPGFRGAWVQGKKIISIGIGVKKWVTYHGMAINIKRDISHFRFIKPCGLDNTEIVSLEDVLGRKADLKDAKDKIISSFKKISLLAETVSKN